MLVYHIWFVERVEARPKSEGIKRENEERKHKGKRRTQESSKERLFLSSCFLLLSFFLFLFSRFYLFFSLTFSLSPYFLFRSFCVSQSDELTNMKGHA